MAQLAPGWRSRRGFDPVSTGAAIDDFSLSKDDASRSRRPVLIAGKMVRGVLCIGVGLGAVLAVALLTATHNQATAAAESAAASLLLGGGTAAGEADEWWAGRNRHRKAAE